MAQEDDELNGADIGEDMNELSGSMSQDRAQRFYDRLRDRVRTYLEKKGALAGKTGEYLMLIPDIFILLWRLVNDPRVNAKNKVMLGSGLAYYIFPLDLIPDVTAIGYLDDLIFGVILLNKVLGDTDAAILREHWSGSDDILTSIQNVMGAAENLIGSDIISKFKKTMK
ncbi:MAG TPA: DUF1232 domain-containing protein [Thermoanaerobaculia bacterium]|jgi:uncharacterized membrane protein YkvA (DUF1232 family)|nr:DUF1232 domain-containing protein [Thermoanaerobaculia bacterium]